LNFRQLSLHKKTTGRQLKEISFDLDLDFYTNHNNISNQELVKETIEYFQQGPGKRAFKPLTLLNLLWKQYNFILETIDQPNLVIETLVNLPLFPLEKHILFGVIIKWFGGYPLEAPSRLPGSESHYKFRKELLNVFLSYIDDTPEKQYCKADLNRRIEGQAVAIALEKYLNYGLDMKTALEATGAILEVENSYRNFEDLFADAFKNGALKKSTTSNNYLLELTRYNFEFNTWLQKTKNWEYGDRVQYKNFLKLEIFLGFLKSLDADNESYSRRQRDN